MGDFNIFYASGQAIISGVNPYSVPGYYSPLYVALLFAPLTVLPLSLAFQFYAALVFLLCGLSFYALTKRITYTILLMLSPLPLMSAWYGNLEAWVLAGAVVSPIIGIWLALAKPQIGLVLAALLVWQAWARRESISRLIVPVGAAYAVSLLAGMWQTTPIDGAWNISLWPLGLLVGIPAAIMALRRRKIDLALFAGPFISPYLGGPSSYIGVLPLLTRRWWLAVIGVMASWLLVFYWRSRV